MTTSTSSLDPRALRRTFGAYPAGIALIAADIDGKTVGMLANSFTSVSLDPPLVSVSFAHTSTTWPVLSQAQQVGISILGANDQERANLLRRPTAHRFDGIDMHKSGESTLVLPETAATLTVDRYSDIQAGDHVICLFQVVDHYRADNAPPLVFHSGELHELAH